MNIQFSAEMLLVLFENKEKIDDVKVISFKENEVTVESLTLNPGALTTFANTGDAVNQTWKMLFDDPMGGGRCFSQRAPFYEFQITA